MFLGLNENIAEDDYSLDIAIMLEGCWELLARKYPGTIVVKTPDGFSYGLDLIQEDDVKAVEADFDQACQFAAIQLANHNVVDIIPD